MRLGKQIDSAGNIHTFTTADIDAAIEANNRIPFRVPIILTHKTPDGVADHAIADHPKTMGIVGKFRRVGNEVKGTILRATNEFLQKVENGEITDRSVSVYTKNAKTNPSPGTFFFRHLAALASENPAIKGMPDMAEELGLSESIAAFSEDSPESYIEFSTPIPEVSMSDPVPESITPLEEEPRSMSYASTDELNALKTQSEATQKQLGAIESSLKSISEFMDGMKGGSATKGRSSKNPPFLEDDAEEGDEEDDTPTPKKKRSTTKTDMSEKTPPDKTASQPTEELQVLKVQVTNLEEENTTLKTQVAEFKSKVEELTPKPDPQPTAQELQLKAQVQKHQAIIALQESEALRSDINQCLDKHKEQITPGLKSKNAIDYTERTYSTEHAQFNEESKSRDFVLVDFMERVAKGQTDRGDYEGFKHWLGLLPKQVDLSERSIVPNGAVGGQQQSITPDQLAVEAKSLWSKKQAEGLNISFSEALDEVIAAKQVA